MKRGVFFWGLVLLVACFLQGCIVAPPGAPVDEAPGERIVYGQTYYMEPPVVVAYPYSHWMYMRNGPYVDVVFIDHAGVRHVERWAHNGVRVTPVRAVVLHREVYRKTVVIEKRDPRKPPTPGKPGPIVHKPEPAKAPAKVPAKMEPAKKEPTKKEPAKKEPAKKKDEKKKDEK